MLAAPESSTITDSFEVAAEAEPARMKAGVNAVNAAVLRNWRRCMIDLSESRRTNVLDPCGGTASISSRLWGNLVLARFNIAFVKAADFLAAVVFFGRDSGYVVGVVPIVGAEA
ncbi:MAG: hypothetical protein P8Y78_07590, partial [Acidihalobacter sp.]